MSAPDARRARTTIAAARDYWTWIALGYVAALAVGLAFGALVRAAGAWEEGSAWERALLGALRIELPPVLDTAMLVLPWLGTNVTLIPLLAGAALWLDRVRRRRDLAIHLLVVELGSYTANPILKAIFSRARPDLWEKRGQFAWSSYPSGHAIASVAVLLAIAWLLRRERGWRWPWIVAGVLLAVSLYSRVYLGVHWPTDVLGGSLVGLVWLLATIVAYRAGGTTTRT